MEPYERRTAEGILFTDEYQLTMAQLYFRMGLGERRAQFDHFFRTYPDYGGHAAGYCIAAGLEWLLHWMQTSRFRAKDIDYLRSQRDRAGQPLFGEDFLAWLREHGSFEGITLHAIPEGRVVHPQIPITTVQGPLIMAQILESSLLNHINFQTLIATKAARLHESGRGQPVLEFGLRRAQGEAANAGARAAMIGGADFTSNTGISQILGYPPKGTHAHSMVQVFMALGEGELGAFRAYADIYPDECLFLVDTINTLESGVPNAIKVFEELARKGHQPVGIRLDSGDLAYLSIRSAKMLNDAGFPDTRIVLSSELDELVIMQIINQIGMEAPRYGLDPNQLIRRLTFGVGTRLITSHGAPALDGVYKLVAVQNGNAWVPAIKVSDTPAKTPIPGEKRAWRVYDDQGKATADLLSLRDEPVQSMEQILLHHPSKPTSFRVLTRKEISGIEPLLVEILREGNLVYDLPSIEDMRALREADLDRLYPGVKRLLNPHVYHVSLTERLWNLKQALVASAME